MCAISRRDFLKMAGIGVGVGGALLATENAQAATVGDPNQHIGMLYDTTMCTGCHACSAACRQWNGTEAELDASGLYDAPTELTGDTWTLIQLQQGEGEDSFVKRQCMHCVDPGCVSGCPVSALEKTPYGPVTYNPARCIGCRYCMYTCPFDVPRFTWDDVLPVITKCTLCADRISAGDGPACAERCPTGALIWGTRGELLEEAEKRMADNPGRYVDHIYGKDDAGGTSVIYLSHVPFQGLGLPNLGTEPIPELSERMGNIFIPSILLGGPLLLAGIRFVAKRDGWG